jgi:hypothetical protein
MKELKSKKSGAISILSDEEYKEVVDNGVIDLKRFVVTDLHKQTIIPSLKEVKEIKITKKTKE